MGRQENRTLELDDLFPPMFDLTEVVGCLPGEGWTVEKLVAMSRRKTFPPVLKLSNGCWGVRKTDLAEWIAGRWTPQGSDDARRREIRRRIRQPAAVRSVAPTSGRRRLSAN